MALYSWFKRNTTKSNRKTVKVNNNVLKASESVKYIENYTMWPTAKIKPGIDITTPVFDDVEDKSAKQANKHKAKLAAEQISIAAALMVNK